MASSTARDCTRTAVTRARAQAEAAEWAYLAQQATAAEALADAEGAGSFAGQATIAGMILELAAETGWSEFGVRRRANAAHTLGPISSGDFHRR